MSEENCSDCSHVNSHMDDGICYSCKHYYASKFEKKPEEKKPEEKKPEEKKEVQLDWKINVFAWVA